MISFLNNFIQTTIHKLWVLWYLVRFSLTLLKRGLVHDLSKYSKFEEPHFRRQLSSLKHTTYGTPEYQALLESIRPALDHHYAHNSHHPQFYPNGIEGMSLLDEIEMLADWRAATRRHADGSIVSSITKNADRFGYNKERMHSYLRCVKEAL